VTGHLPRLAAGAVIRCKRMATRPRVVRSLHLQKSTSFDAMQEGTTIQHLDGRVELREPEVVRGSRLYNEDLAPVPVARRTWSTWDYAALWISMAHNIPTYTLASSMIGRGMNWWQALLTILVGNVIVLAPILLNSHAGTKYGIPYPVFARAAYGTTGANLPALMRALVACGWFGIDVWIGGQALQAFLTALSPGWRDLAGTIRGYPGTQWISFLLFWGINIAVIYRGMELVRRVERFAAPFVLVLTLILVVWAVDAADGLGPIMAQRGTWKEFTPVFIPALTATIGFWSTLALNMPDFTRYGRSQRQQAVGQVVALPSTMTVFAAMGILVTSATVTIYGVPIWDPIELGSRFDNRLVVGVAMLTVMVAMLAVNIAANVVSTANDFANLFPSKINFPRGGLIAGVIGILMMPWKLYENPGRYIYGWLVGYSGSVGSIAGVLIVDYWILRRTELDLHALYTPDGAYRYTNGWNIPAVVATLVGTGVALLGAFWPPMQPIYDWSWFIGIGLASALYWAMMRSRVTPR
jgi:NCS1 family nucleobase:cation symporter-1